MSNQNTGRTHIPTAGHLASIYNYNTLEVVFFVIVIIYRARHIYLAVRVY